MKLRHLFFLAFFLCALVASGALSAQLFVLPPISSCNARCGEWSLSGDLLYLKPMVNAVRWAQATDNNSPIRQNSLMRPDLDWGFRVGVGYDHDCSYGEVSYLWYESLDTAKVARSEFVLPITIFGLGDNDAFQKGSYRLLFRYQNVDLRWGQHITDRCGRTLNLFGNVRWVDLQRKSQARGVATAGGVGLWDQNSRFTGAALGVGASADVSIWRCLSFAGTVNGMAAIGERKVTLNRRSVPVPANDRIEQQPGESSVIPALDLRFGVRYVQLACGCVEVRAEVGYEFHHYWNALDYTQQGTDDIGIVPCQDVGFGGPYLSLQGRY